MPYKNTRPDESSSRRSWLCLVSALTFWIPTKLLICCGIREHKVQTAWKEKFALNFLIWLMCALVLFWIIGLNRILCPRVRMQSQGEIDGYNTTSNPMVSIYGNYYKIKDIYKTHVIEQQFLNSEAMKNAVLGRDMSPIFFKTAQWDKNCQQIAQPAGWDNINREIPINFQKTWYMHAANDPKTGKQKDYLNLLQPLKRGAIARDEKWIRQYLADDPIRHRLIVAYGRVYDVSTYLDDSNQVAFLGPEFKSIFQQLGPKGADATSLFQDLKQMYSPDKWNRLLNCMDYLFYTGMVDFRNSKQCIVSNYVLLATSAILVAVIGFKFLAALQALAGISRLTLGKRYPADFSRFCIIQVPCYTEGLDSLQKTIESIVETNYSDDHKLLFIICDGLVVGAGNDQSTPDILLKYLQIKSSEWIKQDKLYLSLGKDDLELNYARVYSGWHSIRGKRVPFVVVVKSGNQTELQKPGNRGKRDSQLILMKFLNRVFFDAPMEPLELEIYHQMLFRLMLDPKKYEFVLMVDSDTELAFDSINRMVSCMIQDSRIAGICGETAISNNKETWVTMIQQYEYFISHHMAKAFESMFGSVTCLPGCFSMYRIRSPSMDVPYLIAPSILKGYSEKKVETLHKKNLLHLGEDRYLTTLMMKFHPQMKLSFTPDAKCKTTVPDNWSVFVSQRRRWINSTVHNLLELLNLPQLCGFCLFSMRFVVFLDLFATIVQPSAALYVFYLVYVLFIEQQDETNQQVPLISLVMLAAIYGVQVVIFILQREWQHIGWMVVYLLALPVYALYLPLYSFWHFDDFSWGSTRIVTESQGNERQGKSAESVPLMKWEEYQKLVQQHLTSLLKDQE